MTPKQMADELPDFVVSSRAGQAQASPESTVPVIAPWHPEPALARLCLQLLCDLAAADRWLCCEQALSEP